MWKLSLMVIIGGALAARNAGAQAIALTIAQAELEGASVAASDAPPGNISSYFTQRPWGGTSERRCVASAPQDSLPGGSLRSGEFIARSGWTGRWGLQAGKRHKVLWMPLHSNSQDRDTIELRAARLGAPTDTLRQLISKDALEGFPSIVEFPRAGDWLVVVRRGVDWGCFKLLVAE